MAFNSSIYYELIKKVEFKMKRGQVYFSASDIVHDLFLLEDEITLENCAKYIFSKIKKEISAGINFTLNRKVYDDTYVCSKCKEPKPVAAYRLRKETREAYFDYINDTCIECERKLIKEYHSKQKDKIEYKEKNKKRAKDWHWSNRELVLQYQKERRQTPEYKQKMKEYRERNQEKIRTQVKAARIRRKEIIIKLAA